MKHIILSVFAIPFVLNAALVQPDIEVGRGESLNYSGTTVLDQGLFIENRGGSINFSGQSGAGNSTITNFGYDDSVPVRIHFAGNASAGTSTIYNISRDSEILFDGYATAGTLGETTTGSADIYNGPQGQVIFAGNSHTASSRIINNGGGGSIIVKDYATIGQGTTNDSSYNSTFTNNGTGSKIFIGGDVRSRNLNIISNGTSAQVTITDRFVAEYGNFRINSNGTGSSLSVGGNVEIRSPVIMFLAGANGNNAAIRIGENATITGNPRFYIGGTNRYGTSLIITGNAVINKTGTTASTMNGINSYMEISGNATINGNMAFNYANGTTYAANSTTVITDNAKFIGAGIGNQSLYSTASASGQFIFSGNALIKDTWIRIEGANNTVNITGNANLENTRLDLRAGAQLNIAMDGGRALEIPTLFNNGASAVINFTGDADQELILSANQTASMGSFKFIEDGVRGSVTMNLKSNRALTLKEQNTITGNFTVNDGNLTIDHLNALDTATFVINAGNITYGANITDNITFGGLGGVGTFNASITDYYIGKNNYDSTFDGTIEGAGGITKTGDGVLNFGANTVVSGYSGQIVVDSGALGFNNTDFSSLGSVITVNAGGGLRVGEGNSMLDKVSLASDSFIDVYVSKNGSLVSNGNLFIADLQGTDMAEVIYKATVDPEGENLSSGDIIKDFLSTTDSQVVAEGDKTYDKVKSTNTRSFVMNATLNGSQVDFSLEVLTNSLADYAKNSNQAAIAGALDSVIQNYPGSDLAQAAEHADDVGTVLDSVNPAGLSSMGRLVYEQTNTEVETIASRLEMQRHLSSDLRKNGQMQNAVLRVSSTVKSFQIPASSLLVSNGGRVVAVDDSSSAGAMENTWSAYLAATGSFGDMDGDSDSAGYDYRLAGITVGLDKPIGANEGIAGFQVSYHNGKSNLDKPSEGTVKLNSARVAGYAGWLTRSGMSLQVHAALSYHDYDVERSTFGGVARGDTKGYGAAVAGELAKAFMLDRALHWKHGPFLRLTYDWLRIKDFTEAGAPTAMYFSSQTPDSLRSILGWKLWYENTNASGTALLLNARIGWGHEFQNPNQAITARFAEYGAGFTVRGPDASRESAIVGIGAQILFRSQRYISLQYRGELNSDQNTHFINGALGLKF